MSHVMDTDELIASVKSRISIPDNQSRMTDARILEFANEEFVMKLMPLIVGKHEDYYQTRLDLEITDNTKKTYPIPYRAYGSKLRQLGYYNGSDPLDYYEIDRTSIDDRHNCYDSNSGSALKFYFQNENIILNTTSSISMDYLVFVFNMKPNKLVSTDRVANVTGIDASSGIVTVSSLPENFTSSSQIDFIKASAPSKILDYDIDIVDLNQNAKYFQFAPEDIPTQLAIGDRIGLKGESDLIYAPSELHPLLAQYTAARILQSIGDRENLQDAKNDIAVMESNTGNIIDNRNTGSAIRANTRKRFRRRR